MTKFVVEVGAALELAKSGRAIAPGLDVEAPSLIRFEALSLLRDEVVRGERTANEAYAMYRRLIEMPIRQLGDSALQRRAWEVAEQFGWPDTYRAEYVAMARMHKATLVTVDEQLAREVDGFVRTASLDALR